MLSIRQLGVCSVVCLALGTMPRLVQAQSFGVELLSNLNPASGGMAGTGIAKPQDLQTALAVNPATLTQMKGTNFSFSGAWAEPTIGLDQRTALAAPTNITPFNAKSSRPGSIVGNIGVTQDYSALGLPVTAGVGFLTASGLGVDYRGEAASNGTTAELAILASVMGAGVQLTDRLSVGAVATVATANMDGIFTGISAATPDYNLRGLFGLTYVLTDTTTIGGYWHTQEKHTFDNFVRVGGPGAPFLDFTMSLPPVYGLGIANEALMDGRLLVAVDFTYLDWSQSDFFSAIWEDQFAVQTGLQYTTELGIKLRAGYTYATNASRNVVAPSFGPITPQAGVDYVQALFPNINEHRISAGIGLHDLLPGVDLDLFAGGMFDQTHDFGNSSVSAASYWVGFGTTWRFGRGSCESLNIPNQW